MRRVPTEVRFWRYVRKTPKCWLWVGYLHHGYGVICGDEDKNLRAHRVSWIIHNGPIKDGLLVCHHCDNRRCVRPDHLFLGTYADNNADMSCKGRVKFNPQYGEKCGASKLTVAQVIKIRQLQAKGITLQELANRFGVGLNTVHCIATRKTWRHI
jgi:HNH endonuclease